MKHRVRLSMAIAGIVAAAMFTASCGDSGSPTEPSRSAAITGQWFGAFNGVSYNCDAPAEATFGEYRGSVSGTIIVSRPCGDIFQFRGALQGNTLLGELTDFDGGRLSARGTVSGGDLEVQIEGGFFGSSRLALHR